MFWPIFISAVTFWGLALGGAAWFARRYARAIEARNAGDARIAELERRVAALESSPGAAAAIPPAPPAEPLERVGGRARAALGPGEGTPA